MSLLLVGASEELGTAVVRHLVAQGDEVRVIETDAGRAAVYTELGAHVARGDAADLDLLERAATNVRTVVLFASGIAAGEAVDLLARVARTGSVDRVVLYARRGIDDALRRLEKGSVDFVALTGPGGLIRRGSPSPIDIARAIDAADDLAGNPRFVLDLGEDDAWRTLGVDRG